MSQIFNLGPQFFEKKNSEKKWLFENFKKKFLKKKNFKSENLNQKSETWDPLGIQPSTWLQKIRKFAQKM